jgi:hypothetical protein
MLKREYMKTVSSLIKKRRGWLKQKQPTYRLMMAVQRAQILISARAFAVVREMNFGLGHGLPSLHWLANEKQKTKTPP